MDRDKRYSEPGFAYGTAPTSYRFSFVMEEFYEQNPEERIWRQFADDPLWGKG